MGKFEKKYRSSEHFFQAAKFSGPNATKEDLEYARYIAESDSPNKARTLAIQKKARWGKALHCKEGCSEKKSVNELIDEYKDVAKIRPDWDKVKDEVMLIAVRSKFSQHDDLRDLLLKTKNRELVEHTHRDSYWADGGEGWDRKKLGTGKNMLGKTLVKVREELMTIDELFP